MSLPLASIDSLTSRLVLRYPRGSTVYVARPIRSIETRSLPTLTRSYPRHFTFYVSDPIRSIDVRRACDPAEVSKQLVAKLL